MCIDVVFAFTQIGYIKSSCLHYWFCINPEESIFRDVLVNNNFDLTKPPC